MRAHSWIVAPVVIISSISMMTLFKFPFDSSFTKVDMCFVSNELSTFLILSVLEILTWLVVRRDLYKSWEYGSSSEDATLFASSSAWLYHLVKYCLTRWVGTAVITTCHGWSWIRSIRLVVLMRVASLIHSILAIALPLPYLRRWTRCLMMRS